MSHPPQTPAGRPEAERRWSAPRRRRLQRARGAMPAMVLPEDLYQALVTAVAASAGVWWR